MEFFYWLLLGLGAFLAVGTLASFSNSAHWAVRNWDFPRVQIAVVAAAAGTLFVGFFWTGSVAHWIWIFAVAGTVLWQAVNIIPYTRLAGVHVKDATGEPSLPRIRLVVSNVQMENEEHEKWLEVISAADPDICVALEVDARWAAALEPLRKAYPHQVQQVQENFYGMILFSRLELVDPQVKFLVEDEHPSIHTKVKLKNGASVSFYALHPPPPEPLRDQDSKPRDAELVIVGKELQKKCEPAIVAGDLNDVAWSHTTSLFHRLSGMLDPRLGRGFFNTYNAKNWFFRFPLDHVFHSPHFRLVELKCLPSVGSDHFPVSIELEYHAEQQEATTPSDCGDEEEAEELVDRAKE